METEDDHGSQAQNLHDLQNYLSTFKKEIEPGDDILSHMDVDTGDVNDLYSSTAGASLQELGEGGVVSQFSSGFYSEQGILDTPLSDDTPLQIQGIDASGEAHSKDKDLDSDQAQMASFGDSPLVQGISDIQTNPIAGSLIMTSLGNSLDPSGGKVIRIVSLDEDGQYLSLGDTSQMQILSQDLDMTSDATDGVLALQGTDSGGSRLPTSILTSTNRSAMVVTGSGDTITTSALSKSSLVSNEMVTLQTSTDNSQPQIVALPQGAEALTTMSSLLNADGTLNPELGFQTITIMPHELCQGGDLNYVLIMAQQDGSKEATQQLAQIIDLKQENHELSEDLVEINGEVKRVLRVVPKKYLAANFGMQLVCDYCDYTSPKRYLLTRHMKSHSDERPHKCKECDRGFKTPASLMNHVNTHTGIRPHKCKNCDAAFTTSGELVRHIRYRHTFEKPHRCPSCDYASVELSKLKRHMRSHTGERPYKCPHCPYASPDTYKLKRHLRIHTGEKPYECDICHTRFTQSNSLKAHKLIHSGNKPVFQCKLCPTTCGRKTDLKIHFNKLHSEGSNLECKKCGQMFSDRYSYKQHVRSHDFEKCFKCDQCDFIANTDRSFDAHAAIHSDGKKFECDTCHVTFNLRQSLDKHKQNCPSGEDLDSSKDKDSAEKSQVYNVFQQNKMDILLGNESSSSSSMANGGPLASGTLHRNLLQDIKDGKLGHVPQVVIVHPDGSLEEISSKLPIGDKINIDDLFSALSNNEKQQELESSSVVDNSEDRDIDNAESSDHTVQGSPGRTKHWNKDLTGAENEEETAGESSQCEASTQAEIESDTEADFVGDGHRMDSLEPKDNKTSLHDQFLNNSHSPSPLDHSEISTNMSDSMSDAMVAHISNDTLSAHVSNASSEALSSLMAPSSASSSSSPPLATLLTTERSATCSSQHYVVVKGYTCLSSETGQPTLVNVAVDKDSLMKMLASLGSMSESAGVQLLAGDIDSLSLDGKSNVISMTLEQLNDFAGLASLSAVTDGSVLEQTDSTCLEETWKSTPALDVPKGSTMLNRQFKYSTLSIDALSMGNSPHNVDSSLPKELLSPSITSQSKGSPPLPSSSLTPQVNAFNSSLPVEQLESPLELAGSQNPGMSPGSAIDVGTEIFPEVTAMKTEISEPALQGHESNCNSNCLGNQSMPTEPDVQAGSQVEEMSESVYKMEPIHSIDKRKRYSRKRSSGSADPSLVMTGKRVRKALVKVSM